MKKSQFVQFLLTLLFGPLGLFYSSTGAGLGFTLVTISLGAVTGGIAAILMWVVSILTGFLTVSNYNAAIAKSDRQHAELVAAATRPTEPGQD